MIETIVNLWTQGGFWGKAYLVFAVIMIDFMVWSLRHNHKENHAKIIEFITKAMKENRSVVGKLTCLSLHGNGKPEDYQAEYMYYVNGKRYFVTYEIAYELDQETSKTEVSGDVLATKIWKAMLFFYDEKDPSKVYCKPEIFTSLTAMRKIVTPKENTWRDVHDEWSTPVWLVKKR